MLPSPQLRVNPVPPALPLDHFQTLVHPPVPKPVFPCFGQHHSPDYENSTHLMRSCYQLSTKHFG